MSQDTDYEETKPFLNSDQDQLESSRHICTCKKGPGARSFVGQICPWIVSAISWFVVAYLLLSRHGDISARSTTSNENSTCLSDTHSPQNSYFPTDFEPLRSSVEYETRTFTGALSWNETSRRYYRETSTLEPQYFGPPTDDIDTAWQEIFEHEWTYLLDVEAAPYLPELKPINGAYWFEPDMYHSLHCLNEVRKRIDVDYYSQPEHDGVHIIQDDWDRIHIDHCLDQLRQTITCFGDLSPVPLYSWEGAALGIGKGTEHTCRKWKPIRQWVDERHPKKDDM